MQPTKLVYLEDFNLLESNVQVLEVTKENDRDVVILNETVFYAQGGGQPYDTGTMESANGRFLVEEVRFVEGIVKHIGKFESGNFQAGETVKCLVDTERRKLHSRLHSAGHVVDMAVNELKLPWIPGKGYHFPNGPYVEYDGNLEGIDREKLKTDLQEICNRLIQENHQTKLLFIEKEKMHEVCRHVPDNLPSGKPMRVVIFGTFGVPCGGTHVNSLTDIKELTIRKIKPDGPNIKVGYDVSR